MKAEWISFTFFLIAALVHIGFFVIESFLYQKADGYKYFKVTPEQHLATKVWAKNQGYYNLFLALGVLLGLYFIFKKQVMIAGVVTSYCGLFMIGAGVALWLTEPRMRRGALLQIVPPLLGFIFLFFHVSPFFN
jgi:putative membrane protein